MYDYVRRQTWIREAAGGLRALVLRLGSFLHNLAPRGILAGLELAVSLPHCKSLSLVDTPGGDCGTVSRLRKDLTNALPVSPSLANAKWHHLNLEIIHR
jgi:hypothetical protein